MAKIATTTKMPAGANSNPRSLKASTDTDGVDAEDKPKGKRERLPPVKRHFKRWGRVVKDAALAADRYRRWSRGEDEDDLVKDLAAAADVAKEVEALAQKLRDLMCKLDEEGFVPGTEATGPMKQFDVGSHVKFRDPTRGDGLVYSQLIEAQGWDAGAMFITRTFTHPDKGGRQQSKFLIGIGDPDAGETETLGVVNKSAIVLA